MHNYSNHLMLRRIYTLAQVGEGSMGGEDSEEVWPGEGGKQTSQM